MTTKKITLDQLKDSLRYTFGEQWNKVDLTDYDNWCGFTHFCCDVWNNLDKRIARKPKGDFSKCPKKSPEYAVFVTLPFIGTLYKRLP